MIKMLPDLVGICGVTLILLAYYFLQAGKVTPSSLRYLKMNIAGSFFMLYSLSFNWNLSAVIVEVVWLLISVWGVLKSMRQRAYVKL